ncbi:unnamed protein product [Amoebophrya sp. A120]|nr:unnamed protein product [Amoebophrya sp. A120]|eukprot:GSA120T00022406001.1
MADSSSGPAEITDPIPDPPKNQTKVGAAVTYLSEKGTQIVDKTKEKAKETYSKLQENERVKNLTEKGTAMAATAQEKAKEKYGEFLANEKVQKTLEKTEEYKSKVIEKSGEIKSKVEEKTKEYLDKTKEVKERASVKSKELWSKGKGKIVKIRNEVGLVWGKSAQEVLLQRGEAAKKWKEIKIRGAEELSVSARSEYTTAYLVEKGTLMRWSFRVKDFDIGFGVRVRVMQDGGSVEEDVLPVERYDNVDTIEGSWVADEDRTMVLVFDNTYSRLRSKNVAFLVGTEPAGKDEVEEEAS